MRLFFFPMGYLLSAGVDLGRGEVGKGGPGLVPGLERLSEISSLLVFGRWCPTGGKVLQQMQDRAHS